MSTIYRTSETAAGAWPVKVADDTIRWAFWLSELGWCRAAWIGCNDRYWSPDFERPTIDPTPPQATQPTASEDQVLEFLHLQSRTWETKFPELREFTISTIYSIRFHVEGYLPDRVGPGRRRLTAVGSTLEEACRRLREEITHAQATPTEKRRWAAELISEADAEEKHTNHE